MTNRQNDIEKSRTQLVDLVVIGGGITGACAAWDAAMRGLTVVLLERGDFSCSTSAQSLKILHGGIRYLQHLDFRRLRESCRERSAFLRIAPHLTRALPFVVPTYGYGMQGKMAFRAAFFLLSLLTSGRNKKISDLRQQIPNGTTISREEVIRRFPALNRKNLTGAAVFCDGQMLNPPRLVYSVVKSAMQHKAIALNYCSAKQLATDKNRISGVTVCDELTGDTFEIRTRAVINAAGPFAGTVFPADGSDKFGCTPALSRDMAIVVQRKFSDQAALAAQTKYKDPDAILSRGNRHLFLVPWRNYTLIGVNSRLFRENPNDLTVQSTEIDTFLDEINEALPDLNLRREDVLVVNAGLLPFGDNDDSATNLSFGKRSLVVDQRDAGGPAGLVTAVSVRWTMGRATAQEAVDIVEKHLGKDVTKSVTEFTTIAGGDFASFADLRAAIDADSIMATLDEDVRENIAISYGSDWPIIQDIIERDPQLSQRIDATDVIAASIAYAARHEQAIHLADAILRRTDIATGSRPSATGIKQCAEIMATELNWTPGRVNKECAMVEDLFPFSNVVPRTHDYRGAA